MKEFLSILKSRSFKALMLEPSNNIFVQLFRYCFVGGISFLADTGIMSILVDFGLNKYFAVAIGFIVGLVINYFISKALVFKKEKTKVNNYTEFFIYGIIGIIGLGLTELLIYIFSDLMTLNLLLSKIIAAAIVLIWNFAARKIIIYGRKK